MMRERSDSDSPPISSSLSLVQHVQSSFRNRLLEVWGSVTEVGFGGQVSVSDGGHRFRSDMHKRSICSIGTNGATFNLCNAVGGQFG